MKKTRGIRAIAAGALIAAIGTSSMTAFAQQPAETATPEPTPVATPAAAPTPPPAAAPVADAPVEKPAVGTGATKLKVGGVLWPIYVYDLTEGAEGDNAFDVGRAYLNIVPSWGDRLYARITPDLVRESAAADPVTGTRFPSNTTGSLVLRLKYGYLGYKAAPWADLRIGMQQTPFVEFEENVWGHRFVAKSVVDEFYGMSSSDMGFAVRSKLLDGGLEVVVGGYNGEGYNRPETNKYKEVSGRVTWRAVKAGDEPGLRLTGYYGYGLRAQDAEKVRGVGMVSYESSLFTAAGQYTYLQDGNGAGLTVTGGGPSVFGIVRLPWQTELLARVDMFDPDADTDDDGVTRMIAGAGYRFNEKVRMVADVQRFEFEAPGVDPEQAAYLHIEAGF